MRGVLFAFALAACSPAGAELSPPPVVPDPSLAGRALFVTNKGENTLSKVDLATGEEVRRVPSCAMPHELAVSPDGRFLAVGCYGGTTVDIFGADGLERVTSIELGANARPHGLVWHASGSLYATAEGRKAMVRITDPLGPVPVVTEFATGENGTHMLAVAADERSAWTVNLGSGTVTRIDLVGGAAPIHATVGAEPEGIALTPDGATLWISARGSNEAFALDPATLAIETRLQTGRFPLRLAIRPQGDVAITSDLQDAGLSVIDLGTRRLNRTIPVGGAAEAEARFQVTVLWSDDGSRIYVAETGTDTVAEVDYASGRVLRRFAVGNAGDGLAIAASPRKDSNASDE